MSEKQSILLYSNSKSPIHLSIMEYWFINWRFKIQIYPYDVHSQTSLLRWCFHLWDTNSMCSEYKISWFKPLDKRLTWAQHIKLKRVNLNQRLRLLKNLINKTNIQTLVPTKLFIYKSLLKPKWTNGLQLCGNAKKYNLNKIQTFQNIVLRKLLNVLPYVYNHIIHSNLKMPLRKIYLFGI